MNKLLKYGLIAFVGLGTIGIIAAVISLNTPNSYERKQLERMKDITAPSYMKADFTELERGCSFKCANPGEVRYSYTAGDAQVLRDYSAALVAAGYKKGRSSPSQDVGYYEYTSSNTESRCAQILVQFYPGLGQLNASCYLEKVNMSF